MRIRKKKFQNLMKSINIYIKQQHIEKLDIIVELAQLMCQVFLSLLDICVKGLDNIIEFTGHIC